MRKQISLFFIVILLFNLYFRTEYFGADFLDWEKAGKVIKRFGPESDLKSSQEWIQWAEGQLLYKRFQEKGAQTEDKMKEAILADWEKAEKEVTKTYTRAKFKLNDHWHGYEYLALSYTNLDFREQAFGIHFELTPYGLAIDQVLKRYGKNHLEILDQDGKKIYRYTLAPDVSLKNTPWEILQGQMNENDELWVDFELNDAKSRFVRDVEILAIKAKPNRTPFPKVWNSDY